MLELFLNPQTYVSLLSLTLLEIVLGIDNIIFIAILAGKLPSEQRHQVRIYGLAIALLGRLLLLFGISWLTRLTQPFLSFGHILGVDFDLSGKDLVMLGGGLFLIAKSAHEIYEKVEGDPFAQTKNTSIQNTFMAIMLQIVMIDIIFSLDSIITAVGLVAHLGIMVVAILVSMGVMMVASGGIGDFIDRHPSVKILALSFLLMIGTLLVAEGFDVHIPKGYIYFSLLFALFVEFLNIKGKTRQALSASQPAETRVVN